MKKFKQLGLILIISVLTFTACENDSKKPNEEELITTLKYTLTPQGGGTPISLTFTDLDGEGGDDPVLSVSNLAANTTYNGSIEVLNELESPAEDITEEVEEESEEHQFFYSSSISGVTVSYTDQDGNGNPIGIATTLVTTGSGSGTLVITLRHEPNKSASGVSSGDITNAGGETDIEVTFNITVQ